MLKAIIFDVDGVLVDSRESNIWLFQNLLVKAGYSKPSRDEVLQCFHLPLRQSLEELLGTSNKPEINRLVQLAHDPKLRNSALLNFPPNLEHTLNQLHQHYKLGIVTSRIKIGMDYIFSSVKIAHLFDVVITIEDYKKPKPNPASLRLALKRLNVKPSEAVYVGDSDVDIDAAEAANIKSIHLARIQHPKAAAGIQEFNELLAAIDTLHT